MELRAEDLKGIPPANLRVPRDEFVALWAEAEDAHERLTAANIVHWDVWGVASTCRWLAGATSRLPTGKRYVSRSPVTQREHSAMPERITAELLAGETLLMRANPSPTMAKRHVQYLAAVATLRWAWMGSEPAPYNVVSRADASRTDLAHHRN